VLGETRGEIEHPEGAVRVVEACLEDVGVLEVALDPQPSFGGLDREPSPATLIEQGGKNGLGIEAWHTAPRHITVGTDQCRILAVSYQALLFKAHANREMC